MHPTVLAAYLFFEFSRTAASMSFAGIALFLVSIWAVRNDFLQARGLEKFVALSNLCFAIPLAVFGAEHFSAAQGISRIVPKYMPWPLFWTYFVGAALIAASLSIATRIQVRWSGPLFGIMMFSFAAMLSVPGMLANPRDRIIWALLWREPSFGTGGFCLAAAAMPNGPVRRPLIAFARVLIGGVAVFYGVEHFLHPLNVPGVPLEKFMPAWIPARMLISYLTGAILSIAGAAIVFTKKARMAAAYLGTWILLVVVFVYGPILIASLLDPSTAVKVEGLNYFFDTLLYAGTLLALASAIPRAE